MTLQLNDRAMKYLYGFVEVVLIQVDIFIFHVNFVVMDIEEDKGGSYDTWQVFHENSWSCYRY